MSQPEPEPDAAPSGPERAGASGPTEGFAVDDDGVTVPAHEAGAWQVSFDGRVVVTVRPQRKGAPEGLAHAEWLGVTGYYLEGRSHVALHRDDRVVDLGELDFGAGEGRVAFADEAGGPVVIDKWGLAQRPFHTRGDDVPAFLAAQAAELCRVAQEECGLELWMAFGTLLGAARHGGVIAHDSDLDLAYLSDLDTPAAMSSEISALAKALRRRRIRCVQKTGSFLTALYHAPDGSEASIDIYTCFHFEGQLYETASARAPVPREAVLPLGAMTFEGHELPAPRDVPALLEVSYGPRWQHPDPDFVHEPSHAVRSRFDGWFGNLMRRRRDWEVHWLAQPRAEGPSEFWRWASERVPVGALVVELGVGRGDDAVAFARSGRPVLGFDYARTAGAAIAEVREELDLEQLRWSRLNLYDLRDVVASAERVFTRTESPRTVYARGLVESLRQEESDYFWVLARMVARGEGSRVLLEVDCQPRTGPGHDGVWRFAVRHDELRPRASAAGFVVLEEERVAAPPSAPPGTERWRMLLAGSAGAPTAGQGST